MEEGKVWRGPLSRRQLLKGAVSTVAVVSVAPFVGPGYGQSASEVLA
jgi:hypothetical protein